MHLNTRAGEDKNIRYYQKKLKVEAINETTELYKETLNDHIKSNTKCC